MKGKGVNLQAGCPRSGRQSLAQGKSAQPGSACGPSQARVSGGRSRALQYLIQSSVAHCVGLHSNRRTITQGCADLPWAIRSRPLAWALRGSCTFSFQALSLRRSTFDKVIGG